MLSFDAAALTSSSLFDIHSAALFKCFPYERANDFLLLPCLNVFYSRFFRLGYKKL